MDRAGTWFITFTTYGTRLHGDERGSALRARNGMPTTLLEPDSDRNRRSRRRMAEQPMTLDQRQRASVASTIEQVCEFKGWTLHAMNVRTNHVHVLVTSGASPEAVMNACKAWGTRRLREIGLVSKDAKVWTRHGSTRFVRSEATFGRVARYILEAQGKDLGGVGAAVLE